MKIAIILPYKENYSAGIAGAASLWVADHNKYSVHKKNTTIFGNLHNHRRPLTKNFINIDINTKLFSKTNEYTKKIYEKLKEKYYEIIEVHNRPESALLLLKKKILSKVILIFHNDPLEMTGSKSTLDRYFLLEHCYKIIFVSEWTKKRFFKNLKIYNKNNCLVLHPGFYSINKFPKKKNIIIFSGKLNNSKGYDLFVKTIPDVLKKFPDWKAIVIGSEPREKISFKNKKVKFVGWLNYQKAINLYKKASISIVPSRWEEPFGRTSMETAACGCLTIVSNTGGLKETFKVQKNVILKKLEYKFLFNKINYYIKNKSKLKKIQKQNFFNPLHKIKDKVKILDQIKSSINFNYYLNDSIKILHIGSFNEKNSHRLFNISISNKLSNGFIRNNYDVINFDYRNFFSLFVSVDKKVLEIVNNYRPKIVLLGHNNILKRHTLEVIRSQNIKISMWFEDSLHENGPDYLFNLSLLEKNYDLIDFFFITTDPRQIKTKIPLNKLFFIPIPADPNIENLCIYKNKKREKDLFFGMSHGVNFGKLKKNVSDNREKFIRKLIIENPNISFEVLGINNEEPRWGYDFFKSISNCKMALNLSRGEPVKYYSSNRIASYVANGIPTLIDIRTCYNKFFNSNQMIFYKNYNDLIKKINIFKNDEMSLYKIGLNGKAQYLKYFNNKSVSEYIVIKTLNLNTKKKFIWEK